MRKRVGTHTRSRHIMRKIIQKNGVNFGLQQKRMTCNKQQSRRLFYKNKMADEKYRG